MKLLIIGATGGTGREIVRQAVAQGHEVTALVRDAAKAGFEPAVKLAVGDVLNQGSLQMALEGQEAVISALGTPKPSGPFKEETMLSEGTKYLVGAMQSGGVRRLVCITGVGAGESKGHGPTSYNLFIQPFVLRGTYEDKTRQEDVVRHSGLDWTLVRPAVLTDDPAKGPGAVHAYVDLEGVKVDKISRADVAAWCLHELSDGQYKGQAPLISY